MNTFRLQSSFLFLPFSCRFHSHSPSGFPLDVEPVLPNHIYTTKYDKSQLISHLVDNVVYNKDGIIVVNKPFGFSFSFLSNESKFKKNRSPIYISYSFNDIKEDLEKALNVEFLTPLYVPPRTCSGVSVFGTSNNPRNIIDKRERFETLFTSLTIIIGHLKDQKLDSTFLTFGEGIKKKPKIKTFLKYDVLSSNDTCSLVKVISSSPAVKLLMASKFLVPVLGDEIFGAKVKNIYGIPFFDAKGDMIKLQNIPDSVLDCIQIKNRNISCIPAHMHTQSVNFYFLKSLNFCVSVPPPDYFIWTCKQLNLLDSELLEDKAKFMAL